MKVTGIVERRLFGPDGSPKKQFKGNALWEALKNTVGKDLQIPFVTGYWTTAAIAHNTITSVGKKLMADQLGGTVTTPATAIAIGIGTPGTTALGSEITTNGGARGAATVTNTTTTTTGDTEQWIKTFTFTGSFAITEEGVFNNVSSGGIMVASQSFSAVNVNSGDSFQITHQIKFS